MKAGAVLVAAAALLAGCGGRGENWRLVDDGFDRLSFIEWNSVESAGELRRVRVASVPGGINGGIDYFVARVVIDCEAKTSRVEGLAAYLAGEKLESVSTFDRATRPIGDGTGMESVFEAACLQRVGAKALSYPSLSEMLVGARARLAERNPT